jgi:polar amino acid transport system substrate-binding protein
MDKAVKDALAPKGVLRAGINLSNFLLVSSKLLDGSPEGISTDLAKRIAEEIDVPCEFVSFDRPGELADAVDMDIWDIGNIAFEVERAQTIDFSIPYVLIDANFLVRKDAVFTTNGEVDKAGVRIAVSERSAYDLWLANHFKNAEIIRAKSIQGSHEIFLRGEADVLASLKPKLLEELSSSNDYRIIQTPFTAVKQSVGVKKGNPEAVRFLNDLIGKLIDNGFIGASLKKHRVDQKLSIPDNGN